MEMLEVNDNSKIMDDIEPIGGANEEADDSIMIFGKTSNQDNSALEPDIDDMNSEQIGKRKTIHSMSSISINQRKKYQMPSASVSKSVALTQGFSKKLNIKSQSNDDQILESYSNKLIEQSKVTQSVKEIKDVRELSGGGSKRENNKIFPQAKMSRDG